MRQWEGLYKKAILRRPIWEGTGVARWQGAGNGCAEAGSRGGSSLSLTSLGCLCPSWEHAAVASMTLTCQMSPHVWVLVLLFPRLVIKPWPQTSPPPWAGLASPHPPDLSFKCKLLGDLFPDGLANVTPKTTALHYSISFRAHFIHCSSHFYLLFKGLFSVSN